MFALMKNLAKKALPIIMASGNEGTVHIEQVLDYNKDPSYLRDMILYKLTLDAQRQISRTLLSKREIIRRLGTSAPQLYRLLDQTNYKKSLDQMLILLNILDCDVDVNRQSKECIEKWIPISFSTIRCKRVYPDGLCGLAGV